MFTVYELDVYVYCIRVRCVCLLRYRQNIRYDKIHERQRVHGPVCSGCSGMLGCRKVPIASFGVGAPVTKFLYHSFYLYYLLTNKYIK